MRESIEWISAGICAVWVLIHLFADRLKFLDVIPRSRWLSVAGGISIGYLLLHREVTGLDSLIVYAVAMGLHYLVVDYGLRDHYKDLYRHRGRWVISGALMLGYVLALKLSLHERLIAILFSFLAGATIINVVKEELPSARKASWWAFPLGAVAFSLLLLNT